MSAVSKPARVTRRGQIPQCHSCECGDHAWAPLTRGRVTYVSPEDAHLLRDRIWYSVVNDRVRAGQDRTRTVAYAANQELGKLHRQVMGVTDDQEVDHRHGDTVDNRRSQLRVCDRQQQTRNRAVRACAKAGFKGVSWNARNQKYVATIYSGGEREHLGVFSDPKDAALAYNAAARRVFGEFARLNEVGAE